VVASRLQFEGAQELTAFRGSGFWRLATSGSADRMPDRSPCHVHAYGRPDANAEVSERPVPMSVPARFPL
jgi:hypothetical protein